jgi:septum formation protein
VILGADTVVVIHETEILEKPATHAEARAMLYRLRDVGTSQVVSGLCCIWYQPGLPPKLQQFTERTEVTFGAVSNDEIDTYVATGDPMYVPDCRRCAAGDREAFIPQDTCTATRIQNFNKILTFF